MKGDYSQIGDLAYDLQLIENSQDILPVLESIGESNRKNIFDFLFVSIGEGEYTGVWGDYGVPWVYQEV